MVVIGLALVILDAGYEPLWATALVLAIPLYFMQQSLAAGSVALSATVDYVTMVGWPAVTAIVYTAFTSSTAGEFARAAAPLAGLLVGASVTLVAALCLAQLFGVPRLLNLTLADLNHAAGSGTTSHLLVVPLLLLLTLFFFLNPDTWQVAYGIGGQRLALTFALFAAVGFAAAVARSREIHAELNRTHQQDPSRIPWPRVTVSGQRLTDADRRVPVLTLPQLINVTFAVLGRLLGQVLWVGTAMFTGLVVLGLILVPQSTVQEWLGDGHADRYLTANGFAVSVTLLKVALLLAGFSALYFIVVTSGEANYRREVLEPFSYRLRRLLQVHAAYHAYLELPGREPRPNILVTLLSWISRDGIILAVPAGAFMHQGMAIEVIRTTAVLARRYPIPEPRTLKDRLMAGLLRLMIRMDDNLDEPVPMIPLPKRWDPDTDPLFTASRGTARSTSARSAMRARRSARYVARRRQAMQISPDGDRRVQATNHIGRSATSHTREGNPDHHTHQRRHDPE
jgi:hypothetical protein